MGLAAMKVFRVERKVNTTGQLEKEGPYNPIHAGSDDEWMHSDIYNEMMTAHCDKCHPNVREDFGGMSEIPWYYVFGCPNLDSLKQWFHGYLEPLFQYGFVCNTYEVGDDSYIMGKSMKQVAFSPDNAALLSTIPLNELS